MTKTQVAIRKNRTSATYIVWKRVCTVLSCVGIAAYCVGLVVTITHVAEKKRLARAVRDEATVVAELEQKYYKAVGTISLADALTEGYQKPTRVSYGALKPGAALAAAR